MEASTNTVASYRDTFRLLLRYAGDRLSVPPTKMQIENLDAELIADFLVHVETTRRNGARSRNTRLAAIRSFFRFVAMNDPAEQALCSSQCQLPGSTRDRRLACST
jgi:site-specific recombinase XerD